MDILNALAGVGDVVTVVDTLEKKLMFTELENWRTSLVHSE